MTAYHLTSRRMQISEYLNLNAHLNTCRKMQLERVGHARCVVPKEKRFWWQNSLMGCLLKLLSLFLFETSLCVFWLLSHLSILKNLEPDACCWVLLASATCSTCSQKKKAKARGCCWSIRLVNNALWVTAIGKAHEGISFMQFRQETTAHVKIDLDYDWK